MEVQVEGDVKGHRMIFQLDAEFMTLSGVRIEDSILQPDAHGRVYLTATNFTPNLQKLSPHTLVG